MHLTYISGFYPEIGGPFSAAKELLSLFPEIGIDVRVLSSLPSNYPAADALGFIPDLPFEVDYVREGAFARFLPSYSPDWSRKLKDCQKTTDVFHVNGLFDHYSVLASFIFKKPYILSMQGSLMQDAWNLDPTKKLKKNIFMRVVGERILRNASAVRVMSNVERAGLAYFSHECMGKVHVIPNGIDLAEIDSWLSADFSGKVCDSLKNKRYILFLGRIHPIKGLDRLLQAFSILSASEKEIQLVLAGPDSYGYKSQLSAMARQLGIESRVVFPGLLSAQEKLQVLKNALAFVLPSYSESFGMAVVEAMACGVPVLISSGVGISAEILDAGAGLVVNGAPQEISVALHSLISNTELSRKCSLCGRKLVEEKFEVGTVAKSMAQLYRSVL